MSPVTSPFVRPLHLGDKGQDVIAVKRAMSRIGRLPWAKFDSVYNKKLKAAVAGLQRDTDIKPATGALGEPTFDILVHEKPTKDHPGEKAFDEYANELLWAAYDKAHEDPALTKALELLAVCRKFTGSYVYGGGHGAKLSSLSYSAGMDCSSSTSKALFDVDLYTSPYATNSTGFESYGDWGRGKYITIHANWEHVWVELSLPTAWYRFDTSPHGDGPRGPRVRTRRRFDSTFMHRHPKNL